MVVVHGHERSPQSRDSRIAGEHNDRPPPDFRQLTPPQLSPRGKRATAQDAGEASGTTPDRPTHRAPRAGARRRPRIASISAARWRSRSAASAWSRARGIGQRRERLTGAVQELLVNGRAYPCPCHASIMPHVCHMPVADSRHGQRAAEDLARDRYWLACNPSLVGAGGLLAIIPAMMMRLPRPGVAF